MKPSTHLTPSFPSIPGAVVAFPGSMDHAQHVALSFAEVGALKCFATTFTFDPQSSFFPALSGLPGTEHIWKSLNRRSLRYVPRELVRSYPLWEVLRTVAAMAHMGDTAVDRLWDIGSRKFDEAVARDHVSGAHSVHGFEYTALASFKRAHTQGIPCVLHLPSLDSLRFERLQEEERREYPQLRGASDAYFAAKFSNRYRRRLDEIELSHVIIANSSVTARSHIEAGADPKKVRVVPLAAPPTIHNIEVGDERISSPLRVVWAGSFSVRKGAHYLIDAWRRLDAGRNATLDVYGQVLLPETLLKTGYPETINFHGSVPRDRLFREYERGDILAFPTLSDGFGMVVTEAFSRGLPVITTMEAGAAELVTPRNGIIVEARNAVALQAALQWCLDNRMALQGMRENALETAKGRQWRHFRADTLSQVDIGLREAGFGSQYSLRT